MTKRNRALLPVLGIVAALALGVVLARHVAVHPAKNWGQAIGGRGDDRDHRQDPDEPRPQQSSRLRQSTV